MKTKTRKDGKKINNDNETTTTVNQWSQVQFSPRDHVCKSHQTTSRLCLPITPDNMPVSMWTRHTTD